MRFFANMGFRRTLTLLALTAAVGLQGSATAAPADAANTYASTAIDACPGYVASNVVPSASGLAADLKLAGPACNTYGTDLDNLKLVVEYQTGEHFYYRFQCQLSHQNRY